MRQYTTPTLNITLKKRDGTIATDLVFSKLILTFRNGCYELNKEVQFDEVHEGKFVVKLTQEETSNFAIGNKVEVEINFFSGKDRFATVIKQLRVDRNLLDEVIDDE